MASYTTLDDLNIPALCAQYGWSEPHVKPLKGGAANSSFRVSADGRDYVLTVLDNHDVASAEQLAQQTRTLLGLGIPTAGVVPDTDGRTVTLIDSRPVMLKTWIEGQVCEPLPDDLLTSAGALLARLHELPTDAVDVPVNSRRLSSEQEARIDTFEDRSFAKWLTENLTTIKEREAERQRPPVLCHGDLFADNIICRPDGTIAVIDWETISLDDPLLDLGMAAVGLAQEDGLLSSRRLHLLIDGYTSVRDLSAGDLGELPTEIRHAALIIAFHRYYRHNVRYPDRQKARMHLKMVDFADSVDPLGQGR